MLNKYQKTVEKFLQYLQVEKQYSPDTIRAYKVDLEQFFNSLDSNLPITKISTNNIQQCLQERSRNKMSERTLSRKLASIKSLFKYLARQKDISVNIAKLIKAPYFFLAVGSQANVGGAASAPVVAAEFHPSLATVGVLLAVFGYAVGTYGAIFCAYLMELASKV